MSVLVRILVVAVTLGLAVVINNYREYSRSINPPTFDDTEYWGPGIADKYRENKEIKSFDITTNPKLIEDLIAQLKRPLKLQEPLEGVGFEYGFNTKYLQEIIKYWRDTYLPKWSEHEKNLKKYPHYQTQIQGLNIHFIHVKPTNIEKKKVVPLLLLHGWPGSVREFYDIIPLFTTPNAKSDYVYEIIAPSLPGYGWSQGASKTNFGAAQMAVVLKNLMLRLRHDKFIVQGGDWGSIIGANMAALYPQHVIGYHSNMCGNMSPIGHIKMILTNLLPVFFVNQQYADFYPPLSQLIPRLLEEMGYAHIQGTKPDTIGTALSHNPIGLAAYILEKFSTWTNPEYKNRTDGGLNERFTLDALLDNIMIYYVTNSITTSQRLYAEMFCKAQSDLQMDRIRVNIPVGCARFKHDLMHVTDFQLREKYSNLVHSTHHREGGHFAAMEVPQTLYDDFIEYTKAAFTSTK